MPIGQTESEQQKKLAAICGQLGISLWLTIHLPMNSPYTDDRQKIINDSWERFGEMIYDWTER